MQIYQIDTRKPTLNVHFSCIDFPSISDPPEVSIELGSKLNAVDIREGDDVYFECTIDAFPLAERISWKKDVSNMITRFLRARPQTQCLNLIRFVSVQRTIVIGHRYRQVKTIISHFVGFWVREENI